MTDEIKRIDIKEFRELGFLQELNRCFLHPLGLALEVIVNEEDGSESLGGIWDYRDDPEGMLYGEEYISSDKFISRAVKIGKLYEEKAAFRKEKYGWGIQPVIPEGVKNV
jgi:hypothetical protein